MRSARSVPERRYPGQPAFAGPFLGRDAPPTTPASWANTAPPYRKPSKTERPSHRNDLPSTHGPVWQQEIGRVIGIYDQLSRYEGEPGVVIAYGSMYGNTAQMAEKIARELAVQGVKNIIVYNLSYADISNVIRDIFKYDTLIVGSPTYNGELFPEVGSLLQKISERCIPCRKFAYFGSYTWLEQRYACWENSPRK